MRIARSVTAIVCLSVTIVAGEASADMGGTTVESRKVPVSFLTTTAVPRTKALAPAAKGGIRALAKAQSGVPGIDSLVNFTDQFTAPGFDGAGNPQSVWPYSMVGRAPQAGIPTPFNAPI